MNDNPRKMLRSAFAGPGDDIDASPSWDEFIGAVQMWTLCQQRDVTIGAAAAAFNVDVDLIHRAVLDGYWMDYERRDDSSIDDAIILLEGA